MEQLFLCCVLGSESRKHLVWQLIAVHKLEGPYYLEQVLKIQLMKVRLETLLACSMKCYIVQRRVDWKIPRRQEILNCHIEHSNSNGHKKNSVHFSELKSTKQIFIIPVMGYSCRRTTEQIFNKFCVQKWMSMSNWANSNWQKKKKIRYWWNKFNTKCRHSHTEHGHGIYSMRFER